MHPNMETIHWWHFCHLDRIRNRFYKLHGKPESSTQNHKILSQTELTFLDVTLYKGERFRENQVLDIHTPANKQLFIHASSYHPPTTISTISKGEANQYLCTNSGEKEFGKMTLKLSSRLKQRGYKHNQTVPHINSVKFNQRKHTLFQKQKSCPTKKIVLGTQFSDDTQTKTYTKKNTGN